MSKTKRTTEWEALRYPLSLAASDENDDIFRLSTDDTTPLGFIQTVVEREGGRLFQYHYIHEPFLAVTATYLTRNGERFHIEAYSAKEIDIFTTNIRQGR